MKYESPSKDNVKRKAKRAPFFEPLDIVTRLSSAINSDLLRRQAVQSEERYNEVYREAQKAAMLKKFEVEGKSDDAEKAAFEKFLGINSRLRGINDLLAFNQRAGIDDSEDLGYVLRRARSICEWVLGPLSVEEICIEARHSGGVSLGVPFSDTSLKSKFSLPMTSTHCAAKMMTAYLAYDTTLWEAIKPEVKNSSIFDIVDASRATTVPKDMHIRRMIAIEPTVNMFFQQGIMAVMYKCLKRVGLDVTSLPLQHTVKAFRASVSGKQATIDFSSASDSICIELLRYLLPSEWFECLNSVRCPNMKIAGKNIRLEAFSTMGNATTFPVETLVFWSLAVACEMRETYLTSHRNSPQKTLHRFIPNLGERSRVSVFGDDCILITCVAPRFIRVCNTLGLSVNEKKTFTSEGPGFRESCGGDYYHGRDVRPLYLKAPVSTSRSALEPWLYTLLNGVVRSYKKYFGTATYVYEQSAFELLLGLFKRYNLKLRIVPGDYPDDAGLKGPDSLRLLSVYGASHYPLKVNGQGMVRFTYCKFQYWNTVLRSDEVSLATWLKKSCRDRRDLEAVNFYPVPISFDVGQDPFLRSPERSKGGYLVASAFDSRVEAFGLYP
jgi:hypothetical protein